LVDDKFLVRFDFVSDFPFRTSDEFQRLAQHVRESILKTLIEEPAPQS
jgi:hypothetical protein